MIGTLLGNRYEILEKIGEGGMAEVYKAKCHLLNRFVAVKVLKEEYSKDNDFVDKFKAEAAAAGSISHSNIVNIYDVGSQGNVNYIVMEYIQGRTLKEVIIQSGKLDYNRALDVAIQIAKALECAHKNNIIHKDIKPQNILVTEDWTVKVTDFGIAKASNSVTITNTNKIMGSAHYFSPEQAKGSFLDSRTDIYSLGIVLYEMVTGRVPYDAESPVSVALKHLQEPVVPPTTINNNLPEGLNNLILKAVEKDPISRYQNIKDMLLDLQRIKNNSNYNVELGSNIDDHTKIMAPVIDYSEDEETQTNNTQKSRKKMALILIPLAVLVIVVGFFSGWYFKSIKPKPGDQPITSSEITVPSIKGLSEADAKKVITEKNLKFQVAGREKSDKPEGTVVACSPEEGTPVKPNSEVRVFISSGATQTDIPDLKEIDLKTATDMIQNSGFVLGTVTSEYSDTVPKDSVIRQNPAADANAQKGAKIDLVVSKGPEIKYTNVPDLTGRTLNEALNLLTSAKLQIGNKTEIPVTDKALDGKIVNQNPAKNSQVKEGSAVDISINVYKEPEKVAVPNLKNLTVKAARQLAVDKGFTISTTGQDTDIVESQDPEADKLYPKGTVINVKVKAATTTGGTTTTTTTP